MGNVTVKDFRKYEKLEYKKNKMKLDIDFLTLANNLVCIRDFLSLHCAITSSHYNTPCNKF